MRIAVSGAHRTGKSTIVEGLRRSLSGHALVEEPYHQLEEEGHTFRESPSLEDFELQLERSIRSILEVTPNQIFDRCPADFLAYLSTHPDHDAFDLESWVTRVRTAMERLDLVVFVPIERPDRVSVSMEDSPKLRRRVDEALRALLLDDSLDFGVPCLEVRGTAEERLQQILSHIRDHRLR